MFNLGLLSDAALTGLSDEEKNSLQKQATQQFLLGSLLSNDPSMGLKSAYSVPEQYLSGQRAITEMQQKAADRAAVANFQGRYMPTQFNEASPEYRGPVTPDVAMQQNELRTARAQGLPFNIQNALQDVINLPSASQSSMLGAITSLQPKMQPSGILTNANMQPIGGLPSFDAKTGLVSRPTVQGGNVDFNVTSAPGYGRAVEQNLTYALQPGETPLYDRAGNLVGVRNMNGSVQSLQERETAKAIAGTFGQVEQVVNQVTQQKQPKSRAELLGYTKPPAGAVGGAGATTGASGGFVSELSPAQQAVNLATSKNYGKFTDIALDAALTVGDRKTSAEYLYNAAEQLDPNKLTEFFATGAAYMRAIPGVGDKFDSLVGNVNLLNKTRSEGVLKGLSNIKGNANAFEGGIVDKATTGVTDPKFVTKYVSALEIAAADKDDARQRFIDAYTGDPKAIYTAWANSPDNPRLYNHPKVNQFLNEQIAANPSAPILPAGFQLVQGKSGRYGVKKPDGNVMFIGQ
jgi:hypothetical protein